ncbi:hypothetical protein [uncultured Pelagimonas sp.]|uniref:hypothetical protein n=1 Tax=uncultured Pelagimonas sp. TaxID=1618102 RepID=UPI002610AD54|nr:hypothetical protein [uncultured Pelagimonas sp.]
MLVGTKGADLRHKNQGPDAGKIIFDVKSFVHFKGEITKECVMEERMYGVVLWADEMDSKAVIWCEDHGNLAYYAAAEPCMHRGMALDAGDLIQFDLKEERDCRLARNLQHVNSGYAPDIAMNLQTKQSGGANNVVQFPTARAC